MRKATCLLIVLTLVASSAVDAQKKKSTDFLHVEPAFWWVGMKNPTVQILFHSRNDLTGYNAEVSSPGVTLAEVKKVENPHYLFLTLNIANAKSGIVPISFRNGKKTITFNYELRSKSAAKNRIQGFNASDVMYLIMPDRFANGDVSNDSIPGMYQGANRKIGNARHGGDIKGISDHIDYIRDLGVTTLWLNPVLENNQKRESYHGYAITDLYKVDRRFGTNDDYVAFIQKCHDNGLKVVQDMVMNHIGNEHWLMHDLPEKNWVHQFPQFTRSNYRGSVISDPYKSKYDETLMSNGWFDTTMPDVDQTNALFATYLIQNTLWWIEYAGIDGIRMDTYPYPDKDFMARWAKEVRDEYPSFNIVGEAWVNYIPTTAYWQKDMANKDKYQSYLPSVTDFAFCSAVPQALHEQGGWDTGMSRLYNLLAQDFLYPDANGNLTFLDNHDMTRFFLSCGRDLKKFKLGLAFLLTTRGIPQLYYGTELLMDGDGGHHPNVRKTFPGGWKEDNINAFTKEGRTADQNEAFNYLRTLLNYRKGQTALHTGKLTHYIPEDNVYVYFRSNENGTVMVVLNGNATGKKITTARFAENLGTAKKGREIISGNEITDITSIDIPAQTAFVFELH
jgi:neopullulanase